MPVKCASAIWEWDDSGRRYLCIRRNTYRPSLRSAEADISITLDTLATINKLDTIISIHLKPFYRSR